MSRWGEAPYDFARERHEAENDEPDGRWVAGDYVDLNDIPDLADLEWD
ncbi:MAG TPA: hypothetical protein VF642_12450 [Propionibacteriaceae bacterium]|jgi:hypothetical protein